MTALVLLGACGQPSGGDADRSVAPTVEVPVQPTITAETSTPDAVDPSAAGGGGLFDASQSLTGSTCKPAGGVWSFTGTLTNSDSAEHTFSVAVFVLKNSDGSTVAEKEVSVVVPAGGSETVEVKNFHTGDTTGVECLSGVTVKDQ